MTTDLEILRADLAAARLPISRKRVALFAIVAGATLSAVAFAADHYLGEPAPAHVKASFARFGAWQRLDPIDATKAKVVAFSRHTILYGAPTAKGGTCVELLGEGGFEYAVTCDERRRQGLLVFSGIPVHGSARNLPPVTVAGRIGPDVRSLEARVGRSVEHVRLGLDGFFSFEPTLQDAARRGGLTLYARDAGGSVVDRVRVPAPLVLDSVGSPPRIVRGVDRDPRAKHAFFEIWGYMSLKDLHMRCGPDPCPRWGFAQTGITSTAELASDGSFTFRTPSARPYKRWYLSVQILDKRFVPLDGDAFDSWPVPDAAYWRRAEVEAR